MLQRAGDKSSVLHEILACAENSAAEPARVFHRTQMMLSTVTCTVNIRAHQSLRCTGILGSLANWPVACLS